jgi:hypothetical protein
LWRRRHKKQWNMHCLHSRKDGWTFEGRNSLVIHATFPFKHGWHGTLLNWIVLHDSTCIVLPYSVFLVQRCESDSQNGKGHSQVPKSWTTSSIEVTTSKRNRSLVQSKTTFPSIPKQDRYMKARMRSWWHGLEVDRYHIGYLLEISDTRAPAGQLG